METFTENDLKFKLPAGFIVAGSSGTGKTSFVLRLLANLDLMFHPAPKTVIFAYNHHSPQISKLERQGIKTHFGLPSMDLLRKQQKPLLLVLDDLAIDVSQDFLVEMYTRSIHHLDISTLFVTQDLYSTKAKIARRNSQYIILLRSPAEASVIRTIGSQYSLQRISSPYIKTLLKITIHTCFWTYTQARRND